MEYLETATIIKKIIYMYPVAFKDINDEKIKAIIDVWHEELKKCDYEKTVAKLSDYIKENKYPPSIADIYKPKGRVLTEEEKELIRLARR